MKKYKFQIPIVIILCIFDIFYSSYLFWGEKDIIGYLTPKIGITSGLFLGSLIILFEYYSFNEEKFESYKVSRIPLLIFNIHFYIAVVVKIINLNEILIEQIFISSLMYLIILTIGFIVYGLLTENIMMTWEDISVDNSFRKIW
jgi:hypothetical protein